MNADNADAKTVKQWEFRHLELTRRIVGVFFDVYGELGYGFLESVYRVAMTIALREGGVAVEPEVALQASFRGRSIGTPCRSPGRRRCRRGAQGGTRDRPGPRRPGAELP